MNGRVSSRSSLVFKLAKDYGDIIEQLVKILQNEGVIALPTDTLYGVACLAQSTKAIQRIYGIKGRDLSKPIAICVGEVTDVFKWGHIPKITHAVSNTDLSSHTRSQRHVTMTTGNEDSTISSLLESLLPGPVTIVTQRTEALNKSLNPGTDLIGIRIPDYDFIRELSNRVGEPLALTSANISSQLSPLCINDFSAIHDKLDAIVDGGIIGLSENSRKGSTVFRMLPDGKTFKIIRPGCAYDSTVETLSGKFGLSLSGGV